jgi:hypothetical protein
MTGNRLARRLVPALLVVPLLVLAACSNNAGAGAGSVDEAEANRAYAQCIRDSGVPDFPDPDPDGRLPFGHANRDDPKFQAANEKCRDLLPGGGEHNRSPEDIEKSRAYAKCMRDNGLPDFPDPDADGQFPIGHGAESAIDRDDPKFQAANEKCRELLPQHAGGGR